MLMLLSPSIFRWYEEKSSLGLRVIRACLEVPNAIDILLSCPEFDFFFISASKSVEQGWVDYNRLNGVSQIEQGRGAHPMGGIYFLKDQIPFIEKSVDGSGVDMFRLLAVRLYVFIAEFSVFHEVPTGTS